MKHETDNCESLVRVRAKSLLSTKPTSLTMVMTVALVIGCQTFGGRSDSSVSSYAADDIDPEVGVPLERDETVMARTKKSTNKFVGFITGREPENLARAKELYVQGDAAFREASAMPRGESSKQFMTASKLFRRAQQAAPKTAVQQDAMFMEGESLFFADQLMDASKVYEKLQKEFPRNRHNDKVAARLFAISRYWIETKKVDEQRWTMPVNFTDDTRPAFDVDGHAIRVLDQIRYDDPTGRLADDATMAAAAEHIRQEKFEEADEFLTDLREAFPDSDHLFLAHLLGIRCKLNVYQGPAYSGLVLDEADKLVKQTRTRFPDRLQDPKYRDMVARASAEISYLRAEHLMGRAEYREKRREYRSAQYYYRLILTEHSETPFAEIARDRLKETESLPPVPEQRLAWLTKVFPDSRSGKPLQLNTSVTPAESQEAAPNTETKLR